MWSFLFCNPTGIVLLVILWHIGHMWQKQQEHGGGGDLDKVFYSLVAPLGHFWSAFMKPTDYVTRAPILTRRGRRKKIVVEVWPRDPLVVKGFSTIFCFFSVWTKISGITSNINTGHFRRFYKTNTNTKTKIDTKTKTKITLSTCKVVEARWREAGWQL